VNLVEVQLGFPKPTRQVADVEGVEGLVVELLIAPAARDDRKGPSILAVVIGLESGGVDQLPGRPTPGAAELVVGQWIATA
jgi:hypothetical protein